MKSFLITVGWNSEIHSNQTNMASHFPLIYYGEPQREILPSVYYMYLLVIGSYKLSIYDL